MASGYVLVMFGMEDTPEGVEAVNLKAKPEKIVNKILEGKARVVLLTPPPIILCAPGSS